MAFQISLKRLSYGTRADNKDMPRANTAFNSLQVMQLHQITCCQQSGQTEQQRAAKRQPRNGPFLREKNDDDRQHGRKKKAFQYSHSRNLCGVQSRLGIKTLGGITGDRQDGIAQQKTQEPQLWQVAVRDGKAQEKRAQQISEKPR